MAKASKTKIAALRKRVVQVALQYVGQGEHPPGSNRGILPDKALDYVGCPRGNPWCAAGASLVLHEAGVVHGPKTASSGGIVEWGRKNSAVEEYAEYGNLGEVKGDSPTGYVHTVIVIGGTPEALTAVEFNHADGVRLTHTRSIKDLVMVDPFVLETV